MNSLRWTGVRERRPRSWWKKNVPLPELSSTIVRWESHWAYPISDIPSWFCKLTFTHLVVRLIYRWFPQWLLADHLDNFDTMTSPIEAPRHDAQHRRPLSWMLSKLQSPPKPGSSMRAGAGREKTRLGSCWNVVAVFFLDVCLLFFQKKYVPTLLKKGTFLFICCLSPLKSIGWKREKLWCNMTKPTLRK